jgi:preprotein translocase subunit YajC
MCQLRGHPTQCDYGVGSLSGTTFSGWVPNGSGVFTGIAPVKDGTGTDKVPWEGDANQYFAFSTPYVPNDLGHVFLPTQGVVDAGATTVGDCIIKTVDIADFRLVKTVNGGMCTTTASFKTSFTIPPNSRTATFRTISDFINNGGVGAGDCSLGRIINEDVKPSLTVRMMADCGNGILVPRFASLSPEGGDPLPYRIFFLNSCFAEGTPIRLASGKTVTVESLKLGDKVVSDTKGTILTVTGTSNGVEPEPLVELRDNKGHHLRLTTKHPVVKASGEVVFASAIKKDDRVITDSGIASIVSAERVAFTGQVYNLKLGTAAEQARVGKDGTTMFAGGFLVGDSAMQENRDKPNREVAQLPPAWSRDYVNALVNNPPMKRVLR